MSGRQNILFGILGKFQPQPVISISDGPFSLPVDTGYYVFWVFAGIVPLDDQANKVIWGDAIFYIKDG